MSEIKGPPVTAPAPGIEANGINVIAESERKGPASSLFWPWCASNILVFGVAYGAYFLGFGVSFWQALVAGVAGTVLSRASFGVRGNALPTGVSYVLFVGRETALCSRATLATATVIARLGGGSGNPVKIVAFLVVASIVVGAGVLGFDAIMRLQAWISIATAVLTVGYIALTLDRIDLDAVGFLPSGGAAAVIGLAIFATAGFGISWVKSAADYSRYLPRSASSRGVVWWATLGGAVAPAILVVYGLPLAGSDEELLGALGADPIGALTTLLPARYLVPFVGVAVAGIIGGAVLDIYSSGLNLLTLGLRAPRYVAAAIDGVLMILGTIYIVWFATDFIGPFQGFLITLAVPVAAWCGIFIADVALRREDFDAEALYDPRGRYGSVNVGTVLLMVAATAIGWGLVTNSFASWLTWLGYLMGPIGGKEGDWAFANLGVVVAIVIGFVGYYLLARGAVRTQAARPSVRAS